MKRLCALILALVCLSVLCLPVFAAEDTVTVHAQVPGDWTPYLWAWKTPDNTNVFGAWPGEAMTKNGDWYTIEIPNWANAVIVSNNGTPQTADLAVDSGLDLWIVVGSDASAQVYYEEPNENSVPVDPNGGSNSGPIELDFAYVAGQSALCGDDWNPSSNPMSLVSDTVFECTFENVAAGAYMFKITNGTWDQNWGGDGPDGNYIVKVAEAGNVVIQFDTSTGTISVSGAGAPGTAADLEAAPQQPAELVDAYIAGVGALCGSEWDCADANNKMTKVSDTVFEITYKNVAAGSYELKVTNGTWDMSWGKDGGEANYVLEVATAGDVTISFDSSTNTITATVAEGSAPADPTDAPTEAPTDAPADPTDAPATTPTETTLSAAYKAAVRTRTILIIALIFIGIVAAATVISMIPGKGNNT